MSVRSVLNRCAEFFDESSSQHRKRGDIGWAAMCDLQAEAVLRLLADLDNEQEEETSDGH